MIADSTPTCNPPRVPTFQKQPTDWVSILKRNNALTPDNIRRALKNCKSEHDRQALQAELDKLNAEHPPKGKQASTGRGFGVRRPRVQEKIEIPPEHNFFVSHLPYKPWCSDDLESGLVVRPMGQALTRRYLQHNSPAMVWVLAQDIDRQVDDGYFERCGAPEPNCVVKNPSNGHAHALYYLAAGVCRTSAARIKPLRYLAAIERALCRQLRADPGYAGLVTKNPLHPAWQTTVLHDRRYSLGDLAKHLDLRAVANDKTYRESGLGRNVTTFDTVRVWSYRAVRDFWGPGGFERWHKSVFAKVAEVNCQFPSPLPYSEIRAISKSISTWTWRHITPAGHRDLVERTHTPERQAERGKQATNQAQIASSGGKASGQVRRLAREQERAIARLLRAGGYTQQQIADEIGVPRRTVARWLS
jgi:hypothetical protein